LSTSRANKKEGVKISKTEDAVFVSYKLASKHKNVTNLKRSWLKINMKRYELVEIGNEIPF
jgi:hypothetical protein